MICDFRFDPFLSGSVCPTLLNPIVWYREIAAPLMVVTDNSSFSISLVPAHRFTRSTKAVPTPAPRNSGDTHI